MLSITTAFLQLHLDIEHASWSLVELSEGLPRIERARLSVHYRAGDGSRRREMLTGDWFARDTTGPIQNPSHHGPLQEIQVITQPDREGISAELTFALLEEQPIFCWRAALRNLGSRPVWIDRIDLLQVGQEEGSQVALHSQAGEMAFFSNGWQSWSYSGAYGAQASMRRSRLGPVQSPMGTNPATPIFTKPGRYSSDFFGILADRTHRKALLAGFLSQCEQFGSLEAELSPRTALRMWASGDGARLDPGKSMTTDWAVTGFLDLNQPHPLDPFLRAAALENNAGHFPETPTGWCSWYHFYSRVTATAIEQNLQAVQELRPRLPLDLVQIDDGFESQAGDWFSFKKTFPGGVAPLARQIREKGLTAGLWLAPFIVHPRARLRREHPDWLLRGKWGLPVNAGFVWDTFTTALDLTHPEALEYTCRVVRTAAQEWGFPYLKLDFLYAGGLSGRRHDPSVTRAQALRRGLEAVRAAAGQETFLLGCGVPLGSALGLFESVRIGADVSGDWKPAYWGLHKVFEPEPGMPSARNAIQNILTRAPLHRHWWINDPDCLLVRPGTRLSLAEVQSLAAAIALTGGAYLLSDDLPGLPPDRLRIAEILLPLIDRPAQVLDWLDAPTPCRLRVDLEGPTGPWSLVALFNWKDQAVEAVVRLTDFGLDRETPYTAVSFWTQDVLNSHGEGFGPLSIPAHGNLLLAVRPWESRDLPLYLGSDIHISQGLEVTSWESGRTHACLGLDLPRHASGSILLYLPFTPGHAWLDGNETVWEELGGGIIRIPVEFNRTAKLEIHK